MNTLAFILVLFLAAIPGCLGTESETCKLDDKGLKSVVTCVKEKVGEEILGKLNAVVKEEHCADFECAIKKVCKEHNGDLEKGTKGSLTSEEVEKVRATFKTCLGNA